MPHLFRQKFKSSWEKIITEIRKNNHFIDDEHHHQEYCETQQVQIVTCVKICYTVGKKLRGKTPGSIVIQGQAIIVKDMRRKIY